MNNIIADKKTITFLEDIIAIGGNKNIMKRKDKYLNFINSDTELKKKFENESKKVINLLNKYNNDIEYKNITVQHGGDPFFLISSGIAAVLGVLFVIYKHAKRPKCRLEYPIVDEDEVPTVEELIIKILPKSFVGKFTDAENLLKTIYLELKKISKPFNFLNEDTLGKKIGIESLKIVSSVAADVVTFGAGGDVIISFIFTIKNTIDLLMQIIKQIFDILENNQEIRFIYDILNINFTGGPFGVKCWIKYILDEYGSDSEVYGKICSFFDGILDKLATFIGNALGTMIPDSAGLPGLIIPIIVDKARSGALTYLEKKIDSYYKKIPKHYRVLIKHPKSFKKFLDKKIRKKSTLKVIFKLLGKKKGKQLIITLINNTEMFTHGIHKGFSLMYTLIRIFLECEN